MSRNDALNDVGSKCFIHDVGSISLGPSFVTWNRFIHYIGPICSCVNWETVQRSPLYYINPKRTIYLTDFCRFYTSVRDHAEYRKELYSITVFLPLRATTGGARQKNKPAVPLLASVVVCPATSFHAALETSLVSSSFASNLVGLATPSSAFVI